MGILWWLAPPVVATLLAMLWVGWVSRDRPAGRDQSEAAQQRMGVAIGRELPKAGRGPHPVSRVEPSTGVVVRTPPPAPTRPAAPGVGSTSDGRPRRSA